MNAMNTTIDHTLYVDATDAIAGRLASHVAKQALLGRNIIVVNAEKALITGKPSSIIAAEIEKREIGSATKGPYFPKQADRLLRRMIRGMLPWKRTTGREAFRRVMCYKGVPEPFKEKHIIKVPAAARNEKSAVRHVTIELLCARAGARS